MTRILCAALAAWLAGAWPAAAADARKPNVIIFYADDLGYGECGCYGCKDIPTPHIDSIAKNGTRFTQGYVAATYCSPSRAGLLTGRYPTRFGHEFNEVANLNSTIGLPLTEKTLADRFKALGYATACVGKWHLGPGPEYRPTKRGFDEFYGTLANTPYYHPNLVDTRVSPEPRRVEDKEFYTTDAFRDRAIDWLGKQKGKPFLLYLPFNAQHSPLQAPKKYLDRFSDIKDEKRQLFAAMMAAMDNAIGAVLTKVKDMGQEDNTVVWFVGDNGGPTRQTTSSNGPLRGFKSTTLEGGPRVPFLVKYPGKVPAGKTYDYPVMNLDILPTSLTAAGGEVKDAKLDGVNLLPYLAGKNADRPRMTLYWRFSPQWAVRHGDFKLVRSNIDGMTPKLFNLADDIGETKDLTESHPEKVKELTRLYKAWDEEQIAPLRKPDPAKKKKKNKNKD